MTFFVDSILYSYAQIFFSNRRWFGLTALISTFIVPELGMMALLGVILSNAAASILKFDKEKIKSGFYGFNGILFGAASLFFFELNLFLLLIIPIFIIITFLIAAVIEHYFAVAFNLPGLSLPFVISLFIFIIFLSNFNFITPKQFSFIDYEILKSFPQIVKTYFKSFALILFQSSIISGIILALAVLFFSRVMFLLSIIGFVVNYFVIQLIFPVYNEYILILSAFNSMLTAIAIGGSLIIPSKKSVLFAVLSIVIVVIFTGFFLRLLDGTNLPILVLPFNFVVLTALYGLKFRQEHSDLVLLYFQPGSPEENFYYHHNRKSRFEKAKYFFAELPFFGEWYVSQGHNGEITHKEKWKDAWDFIVVNNEIKDFENKGNSLSDYYCYKLPVAATLDGEVVKVIDQIPDNDIGEMNVKQNWGNTIILNHGEGLYSAVSHLEPDSAKVKEGDKVKKGEILALCGNSGRSPYPHIHFQFQPTDKLGDKTYKFPFAHFIVRNENHYELRSFDYPDEKSFIKNIETHKIIKKAFTFKYGDSFQFEFKSGDNIINEWWEVKIDIMNNYYIENNNGDKAFIYSGGKIFYFTNYIGKKNSALFNFYLASIQVPLCYMPLLKWHDSYPLSKVISNIPRFLSEFLLLFNQQIKAYATLTFPEKLQGDKNYYISNELTFSGKGLFSFYKKKLKSKITINQDSAIELFELFEENNKVVEFKQIIQKENEL